MHITKILRTAVAALSMTLAPVTMHAADCQTVTVGAERPDVYLPMLRGQRVALFSNHTGKLPDGRHTLDALLADSVDVRLIFSPEHGFRGTADAGEHVTSSRDEATGIRIASLYGNGRRGPWPADIDSVDVVVVDIQDVGLRYYTYYCTMLDIINCASARGRRVVVLDRPNPNGMTVDGPVLDMAYASGVGRLPIPVVHGMTLGELARMAVGEGWLADSAGTAQVEVVPCLGYDHQTRYQLPVAPSPNLRTMHAIYLYPATCYFEATPVSLGRGTDMPFEVYGHPDMTGDCTFTPRSMPGAKRPPQMDQECHGRDLRAVTDSAAIAQGVNLEYVIDAYNQLGLPADKFFTPFFEKLIGRGDIRQKIADGWTAEQIRQTWADDVARFRAQRSPYLLYKE